MNFEQARTIPMTAILTKLGHEPVRKDTTHAWYISPIRRKKAETFCVCLKTNRWFDTAKLVGGDPVDFVCAYLKYTKEDHTIHDALRWMRNMMSDTKPFSPPQ
jgi:hypothetical protein